MPNLGEKILSMRKEAGWSRREFARRSGLLETHISKIEHSLRPNIEIETLKKLCLALHCTSDYLIGLDQDPATWEAAAPKQPATAPEPPGLTDDLEKSYTAQTAPPGPRRPRGRPRKRPLAAAAAQP